MQSNASEDKLTFLIADHCDPSLLEQAQESLIALDIAWRNCAEIFDSAGFPEEVLSTQSYPFEKSFSDYNPHDWVKESAEAIDRVLETGLTEDLYWVVVCHGQAYLQGHLFDTHQLEEFKKSRTGEPLLDEPYTVTKVKDLLHLKNCITWENFDITSLPTARDFDSGVEYPEYVPQSLRLPRCVYSASGTTMTNDWIGNKNRTTERYARMLNISPEDMRLRLSPKDILAVQISHHVQNRSLTPEILRNRCLAFEIDKETQREVDEAISEYRFKEEQEAEDER